MKKFKFLPSVLMLIACIAVLAVGVFAVSPTQNTISGSITINASNPEILISAYKHKANGDMEEEPFFPETPARSGINIDLGILAFDVSSCNTEEDLKNLDVKITIKLENLSNEELGVYFTDKLVEDKIQTIEDRIVQKNLTDSTNSTDNVKAEMNEYSRLAPKQDSENGVCFTTITFKLLKFISDGATIDLSAEANRMCLNVEKFNKKILYKDGLINADLGISSLSSQATTRIDVVDALGNSIVISRSSLGEGSVININDYLLAFETGSNEKDIEDITIKYTVTNTAKATTNEEIANNTIGIYFAPNNATFSNQARATRESIATNTTIKNSTETTECVDVQMSNYYALVPNAEGTASKEMTIKLTLIRRLPEINIAYKLVVEPYVSEATADGLLKLPILNSDGSRFTSVPKDILSTMGATRNNVQYVVMPEGITEIADGDLPTITGGEVMLEDNNLVITTSEDAGAFSGTRIKNIEFPNSLIKIGAYAFADYAIQAPIELPHNLTTIGCLAFAKGFNYETEIGYNLYIPKSVTNVETQFASFKTKYMGVNFTCKLGGGIFTNFREEANTSINIYFEKQNPVFNDDYKDAFGTKCWWKTSVLNLSISDDVNSYKFSYTHDKYIETLRDLKIAAKLSSPLV